MFRIWLKPPQGYDTEWESFFLTYTLLLIVCIVLTLILFFFAKKFETSHKKQVNWWWTSYLISIALFGAMTFLLVLTDDGPKILANNKFKIIGYWSIGCIYLIIFNLIITLGIQKFLKGSLPESKKHQAIIY